MSDLARSSVRELSRYLGNKRLSDSLATDEFDKLCFDYGLELDEDVRAAQSKDSESNVDNGLQTTEEVEEAIKKGLPAERPVSYHGYSCSSLVNTERFCIAIENRNTCEQVQRLMMLYCMHL